MRPAGPLDAISTLPGPVPGPPLRKLIPRRVLITGVTGQTGSYLAELLCTRDDVEPWGLIRGQRQEDRDRIQAMIPRLRLVDGDLLDQGSLIRALETSHPERIYHLGAISAPGLCWSQPVLAAEVTGLGTLRLLEAMRAIWGDNRVRVVVAGSLATHGPYGAAKQYAADIAADYRHRGWHVSTAIFGGHHSPRRGREFFSRKVSLAVARIKAGRQESLTLGRIDRVQDWGWADDFAVALTHVMGAPPDEYTISTGKPHSASEWVAGCFAVAKLDWERYVKYDDSLSQPTEPTVPLTADPDPRLGWEPHRDIAGLAHWMVRADMDREALD
jgi:GDPmannose 4,6-dehydratase